MSGVNKVILVGRVGKDPEVRYLESGNQVANFSLATSESYKDKSGNKVDSVEWHNLVVWGSLAGVVEKYVNKGDMLYIEGKIKTRTWDKDGEKRYATDIQVLSLQMLGSKNQNQQTSQPAGAQGEVTEGDLPF